MQDDHSERVPLPPHVREWAMRNQLSEQEILDRLRDVRASGGFELSQFERDLVQACGFD